jgi:hypothetical protein
MLQTTILALATLATGHAVPIEADATARAGAVVLLGEPFELPAECFRDLVAGVESRERVWITPASSPDVAAIDPLARAGRPAHRARLDAGEPHAGDDRELGERVRDAGAIVLTGGSYLEWYALFRPSEKASGLHAALRAAHESGALVVASGAAAAFLAEWTVVDRAALHRPLRNPRDASEHVIARGLGFVRGLADCSGAPHGSIARLLALSEHQLFDAALYLDGHVAWIEAARDGSAAVRGEGAAFVLDFRPARRDRRKLSGGRLSLLLDGDLWSARERTIAGDLAPFMPADASSAPLERSIDAEPDAAWMRDALRREVTPDRDAHVAARGRDLEVALRADARSLVAPTTGAAPGGRSRIAFDLAWRAR